jgi:KDO II ethanolaminephosphotransferase
MNSQKPQLSPWAAVWAAVSNRWPDWTLPLAVYVALLLNVAVLVRRFNQVVPLEGGWKALVWVSLEAFLVLGTTLALLAASRLLGRISLQVVATLMVVFSVLASYYMTFFNVVIGYGVVQAVLTTDVDLSKEAVGSGLLFWFAFLAVPWLVVIWGLRAGPLTHQTRLKTWAHDLRRTAAYAALGAVLIVPSYSHINTLGRSTQKDDAVMIKPAVLAAHSYVPSNWIAGLAMSASNRWASLHQDRVLRDPAQLFSYSASSPLDDTTLVFVIGESARSNNFGLFGYERANTPQLAQLDNLVAFNGISCNTSTKLSLQCMFVRPSAVTDNGLQAPVVSEQPVFSVLKKLGFRIDLFAMQSEVWFYNSVMADFYKIREVIAADPKNAGKASQDNLLLDELATTLKAVPLGRRVIILHTKGSHYLYTSRYPRAFAKYQPECAGIDASCSREQLINSYDNSILYLDDFLAQVTELVKYKKALMVYTSDHGESIAENVHFHATPKPLAPPEQRAVPLMLWASPSFLSDPNLNARFAALKRKAQRPQTAGDRAGPPVGHDNIFDTLLGCLGIRSANGGIDPALDLCHGSDLSQ